LNFRRVDIRRRHNLYQAVEDGIASCVGGEVTPVEYFHADYDDPEEAVAMYNLAASRAEYAKRKATKAASREGYASREEHIGTGVPK
tara:strand:- start:2736 stop:2996 length:261 start_codon:yes stop_codon:yes gene_type:complete